jgi:hypothetical protein
MGARASIPSPSVKAKSKSPRQLVVKPLNLPRLCRAYQINVILPFSIDPIWFEETILKKIRSRGDAEIVQSGVLKLDPQPLKKEEIIAMRFES